MLSSFTPPQVVPKVYEFLSSVKHNKIYILKNVGVSKELMVPLPFIVLIYIFIVYIVENK